MTSPFPGMDPYLEQFWSDVHTRLTTYASDALQRQLPGDLRARIEEQLYIEDPSGGSRRVAPDVAIIEEGGGGPGRAAAEEGGVAVAEALLVHLHEAEHRLRSIQILDLRSGGRVVTSIEFLSLANKMAGRGQELHLQKQEEMKDGGVNLVEIDLLRDGRRVLVLRPEQIPESGRTTYQAVAWRACRPETYEVYRIPLRDRLPILPIPLRERDPDARLDLQALVDRAYENGGYDAIDYRAEPAPPLAGEDAAWADGLLRGRGLR